jgi:propanol-preferring alcohol dehydrogenase
MAGMAWLHSACGTCEHCASGWETLCEHQQMSGYTVDGAYSTYAIATDSHAIKIPHGMDPFQAARKNMCPFCSTVILYFSFNETTDTCIFIQAILCAGVTSYKGLKVTEAKPGQFVAIVGAAGGLGHLAIQYAKAMGMQVVAVDVGKEKLDYCKSLGADFCVDAKPSTVAGALTPAQLVHKCSHGGCHGVLCLATQKAAFKDSIAFTRRHGTMVCVGLPSGNFEVPLLDVVLGGITIRGSIVGTRQDAAEALDFAARGLVKCKVEKAKLDDVVNVLQRVRQNKVEGRIVFEF